MQAPKTKKKCGNTTLMNKDEGASTSKEEINQPSNIVKIELHPSSTQERNGERGVSVWSPCRLMYAHLRHIQ